MRIEQADLLWVTGLTEGDGCFGWSERWPKIYIKMTDRDVVERVAALFCSGVLKETPARAHWSTTYRISVSGKKAAIWMSEMLPFLGLRRSDRVREILAKHDMAMKRRKLVNPNFGIMARQRLDRNTLVDEHVSLSYREMARKYGVSHETIRRIVENFDASGRNKDLLPFSVPGGFSLEVVGGGDLFSWAAGLLEAEGSFMRGPPSSPGTPVISLQMTDRDMVERAKIVLGVSRKIYHYKKSLKNPQHKDVFMFQCRGKAAFELMVKLRPLMGVRRQSQIDAAMACYTPDGQRVAAQKRADLKRTMTDAQVLEMWEFYQKGDSLRSMARQFGVHHETLRYAIKNLVPRILAAQAAAP